MGILHAREKGGLWEHHSSLHPRNCNVISNGEETEPWNAKLIIQVRQWEVAESGLKPKHPDSRVLCLTTVH
jgi:hypothetical protein